MCFHSVLVLCLAFALDCLFGDPEWLPHAVRFIGRLVLFLERRLRNGRDSPAAQRLKGGLLVVLTVAATAAVTAAICHAARLVHPLAALAVEGVLGAQCLAARNLRDESMRVFRALREETLEQARAAVARIVGRDTERLDRAGVIKATVETVAENTTDGVIAPLFYLALGGPVLGMAYKAVSTMDSLIGYRDERYRYFGTAAARSDDCVAFVPARLAALAMLAASCFLRLRTGNAWRVFVRDRSRHDSPNAGQTESVCAGALGVALGGDAWYKGVLEHKATLGDALRPVDDEDIRRANGLLYGTTLICFVLALAARMVCEWMRM